MKTDYNRNQQIIQLYKSGMTQKEVGKKFNITQGAIYFVLKSNNVKCIKNIKGEKNPNWKNGIMFDRGRKLIYSPHHPNPDRIGYCYEYRLIMEKHLGRYLTKNEVVHHINGDVADNRIENLQVVTRKEHIILHHKQGDMKQIYKSKFGFVYDTEQEYRKQYMKKYQEKNKLKLKKYRKNKWENTSQEERKEHNKKERENYQRRKINNVI